MIDHRDVRQLPLLAMKICRLQSPHYLDSPRVLTVIPSMTQSNSGSHNAAFPGATVCRGEHDGALALAHGDQHTLTHPSCCELLLVCLKLEFLGTIVT